MNVMLNRQDRFLTAVVAGVLVLALGCGTAGPSRNQVRTLPDVDRMAVFGFQPALPEYGKPQVTRSPVSGAVFMAEPVPKQRAHTLTGMVMEWMASREGYQLVSPGDARGIYEQVVASDRRVEMGSLQVLQEVGKALEVDAVMAGYIYRWHEREGSQWAVNRPASVAFDLFLLRPRDGAILWKGKFDKTQRSLSENLLDYETFVEGRGRWMTAQELARMGLEQVLGTMPRAGRGPAPGTPEEMEQ